VPVGTSLKDEQFAPESTKKVILVLVGFHLQSYQGLLIGLTEDPLTPLVFIKRHKWNNLFLPFAVRTFFLQVSCVTTFIALSSSFRLDLRVQSLKFTLVCLSLAVRVEAYLFIHYPLYCSHH
jgi:hypothetical protein